MSATLLPRVEMSPAYNHAGKAPLTALAIVALVVFLAVKPSAAVDVCGGYVLDICQVDCTPCDAGKLYLLYSDPDPDPDPDRTSHAYHPCILQERMWRCHATRKFGYADPKRAFLAFQVCGCAGFGDDGCDERPSPLPESTQAHPPIASIQAH